MKGYRELSELARKLNPGLHSQQQVAYGCSGWFSWSAFSAPGRWWAQMRHSAAFGGWNHAVRPEQYVGCLIGLAVGDALGFPAEPMSLAQIREEYGPAGIQDFQAHRGLPAGSCSDDTLLSLAVARALIAAGQRPLDILIDALCHEYLAWYQGPQVQQGPGMTTLRACANLANGLSWRDSGIADSKGCGAAMRVAPIGLYFYGDRERLFSVAERSARITHGHPTGVATAIANAYAVALAKQKIPPEELLGELLRVASPLAGDLAAAVSSGKPESKPEIPEFKDIGKPETGYPVELMSTTTIPPNREIQGRTSSVEEKIIELSTPPLDASLFEVPPGFKKVDHIAHDPEPPLPIKLLRAWEYWKTSSAEQSADRHFANWRPEKNCYPVEFSGAFLDAVALGMDSIFSAALPTSSLAVRIPSAKHLAIPNPATAARLHSPGTRALEAAVPRVGR